MESINIKHCRAVHRGLFVVDLDGTLLTGEHIIAEKDLQSLRRLRSMGYSVAVATGRSNYSFYRLVDQLGFSASEEVLPVDFVIFSTGAGIMDFLGNTLLRSFSLSFQDVCSTVDYLQSSGLDFMVHRPVPDTKFFVYSQNSDNNPDFTRRLEMYGEFASEISRQALVDFSGATEILCIVPAKRGHDVAGALAKALSRYSVIKATSPLDGRSIWIEIFAPTVSKSKAVKWITKNLGIKRDKVCAVGNDYNDEDLLRWAGKSFIVANGPASMKAVFQNVASNDCCGVSEAANRWIYDV